MATAGQPVPCHLTPPSPSGKDGIKRATSPAEDRISRLTDELLSNIVARLPVKDGARTAALSPRWCGVWASTPVDLIDRDLFPDLTDTRLHSDWPAIADQITSILAAHRGPFRNVHLSYSCYHAAAHDSKLLHRWLLILAEKGVHSLVLVNSLNFPTATSDFPADALQNVPTARSSLSALRISSVRCLKLFYWDFPSTEDICRGDNVFPSLRELVLGMSSIESADIDRLLQYSPVLEKFVLAACVNPLPRVLVRSRSLISMIFSESVMHDLHVLVAPKLCRLIFMVKCTDRFIDNGLCTKISIARVPKLEVLGYLDPSIHVLELGDTIIKAETNPSRATKLCSVKVLALKVQLGVPKEANVVISYLKCFPYVETLHVLSKVGELGSFDVKFWQQAGTIHCLRSTLRKLVLKNFQGKDTEFAFLKFVWERAKVLERVMINLADGNDAPSLEEVVCKLQAQVCAKRFRHRKSLLIVCTGGRKCTLEAASNLSVNDPFDI